MPETGMVMSEIKNHYSKAIILTINPRDLATKIALYRYGKILFLKRIRHEPGELEQFDGICDQADFRKDTIMKELHDNEIALDEIRLVIGRGGLCKPVKSGMFEVNDKLREDLSCGEYGMDVLNLGGLLAYAVSQELKNARPFISDPVVMDEFDEISRISGHPLIQRRSVFHALNQKYVARRHARSVGRAYEEMNLIVISLGRAISIGAHRLGRVIDATQGYDGGGPFSPICSGTLPMGDVIRMCFSGKYTREQMLAMIRGEGGLKAYLGTNNGYEVEMRIDAGDDHARFIMEAMAYQVAQSAGAMSMAFPEKTDAVLITGNLANSRTLMNYLVERVSKIAPVHLYPGDDELEAMAHNGMLLLKGEIQPQVYE